MASSIIPFTVGFYNLMTQFVDGRQPAGRKWYQRCIPIALTIKSGSNDEDGPAIIGLVEMNLPMLTFVKMVFPKYKFVGVATMVDKPFDELTTDDYIGELVVIGYRPDLNIELVEQDSRWFSPTPKVPCSKFDEKSRNLRAVHFARFTSPQGPLAVFCSHYDDFSLEARKCAVRVEAEFIHEKTREGDFIISMRDGNFYPDNVTEENPKGDGQVLIDELVSSTGLQAINPSTNHRGPEGTWIGWETDPFCAPLITRCKCHSTAEFIDNKNRVYDLILSNHTPHMTTHHPGMFTSLGLEPISRSGFSGPRLCASDHCAVFAEFSG